MAGGAVDMKRVLHTPREHWRQRLEAVGFGYHSMDGLYWREDYAYEFSGAQVDLLDDVSLELHQLSVSVLDDVLKSGDVAVFGWTDEIWAGIYQSHAQKELSLYGRFDFSYDGKTAPKLLEYNADTPTSLVESSLSQWHWLQDVHPDLDQFNSLHEKIVARWQAIRSTWQRDGKSPLLYFLGVFENEEEAATLDYLNEMAVQAGWQTLWMGMEDVGFNRAAGEFRDVLERPIEAAFKLYPWEWMAREPFGIHVPKTATRWLEPMWKMVWSSKAFMAHLWQAAPNHPNLLPTYFDAASFGGAPYVKKPFASREGTGISLHNTAHDVALPIAEANAGFVYQAYHELPKFGDAWTMVGSWMVGDDTAGLAIREDVTPITRDTSHFVPHYFK